MTPPRYLRGGGKSCLFQNLNGPLQLVDDVDVLAQQEEGLERLKKLILSPAQS